MEEYLTNEQLTAKGFVRGTNGEWSKPKLAKTNSVPSRAIVERPAGGKPLHPAPGKEAHPTRRVVRIVSYRYRILLDRDNLCGKFLLDSLRYAGLIEDDSEREIDYFISQVRVETPAEERTEIEITPWP